MMVAVYFYYPETANLSLEAVDVIFIEDYAGWRGAVKKSLAMHKDAKGRKDLEKLHLAQVTGIISTEAKFDGKKESAVEIE
jgi:hypothetical protein